MCGKLVVEGEEAGVALLDGDVAKVLLEDIRGRLWVEAEATAGEIREPPRSRVSARSAGLIRPGGIEAWGIESTDDWR